MQSRLFIYTVLIGVVSGCAAHPANTCSMPASVMLSNTESHLKGDQNKIRILERRVKDRDLEIATLKMQLDSIKQIDMETSLYKKKRVTAQDRP